MEELVSNNQKANQSQVNKILHLLKKVPESSGFLGNGVYYKRSNRNILFRRQQLPDLSNLREAVHRFSEKKGVNTTRGEVSKLIKKYPYAADLHALKAIQSYNDISQSGQDKSKLDLLEITLSKMSKALHNGGVSIFNVTWFITIYLKYLELLKERLSREYNLCANNENIQIYSAAKKIYEKLLLIPCLFQFSSSLGGLTTLNIKLRNTVLIAEAISMEELSKACHAMARNKKNKMITQNKSATNILTIMFTLTSIFARIPILSTLVREILAHIPNTSRDLILQKKMILNTQKVTDFQIIIASGIKETAKELANRMFISNTNTINKYLENATIGKTFEADPFLKSAWIAIETADLFDLDTSKKRLDESLSLLNILIERTERDTESFNTACKFQNHISLIKNKYGWT